MKKLLVITLLLSLTNLSYPMKTRFPNPISRHTSPELTIISYLTTVENETALSVTYIPGWGYSGSMCRDKNGQFETENLDRTEAKTIYATLAEMFAKPAQEHAEQAIVSKQRATERKQ